ncbi:MAG: response regulator transcription factor [Acidobacteria bacterium]|nr:response regulator transcription factor [Acidobacteriota bacterium]MCW5969910.1 response regulator transcription factor [Blastocatellales bacterium]
MAEIEIVIAENAPIYLVGLKQVIESDPQIRIVAEAKDGSEALRYLRVLRPHVALFDVKMKPMDGFEAARSVREERLPTKIIFLTQCDEEPHFNRALDLGAKGYLLKDTAYIEVVKSIRAVAAGEYYVSSEMTTFLINRNQSRQRAAEDSSILHGLSPTDRRILVMLSEFKTNDEIADALCISRRTVEHHREQICQRLNLRGHHALLQFAVAHRSEL